VRTGTGFRRLWLANGVSLLGDQVSLVAIPLVAVTTLAVSPAEVGLLTAIAGVPLLLFGLPIGAWVDRTRRRRLLIAADLGRAVALSTVPIAFVLGALTFPHLLGVAFALASMSVVFNVAATAVLPSLVPAGGLVAANARLTQTRAVTQIAGPGLGGALVQLATAPFALVVDAVSYLASALLLRRLSDGPIESRDRDVRAGLRLVWREPLLRASALSAGTYSLFNAAILALQVLFLTRELVLSPAQVGLVLAAAGPGALLGATLAVRTSRRLGLGPTMIAGLAVAGLGNLALPLAPVALIVIAIFVNAAAQPLYNISQSSLRQALVPPSLQGRVTATMTVIAGGAAPLGALAGGVVADGVGVRSALVAAAIGTVLSCLWAFASPIRRLRDVPMPL
jgi:predicted MFS family arabinose efflux permease